MHRLTSILLALVSRPRPLFTPTLRTLYTAGMASEPHSIFKKNTMPVCCGSTHIYAMAILGRSENYCYLIVDEVTGESALVDPAEPHEVMRRLSEIMLEHRERFGQEIQVDTILTTHHHWDHAGGNNDIVEALKKMRKNEGHVEVVGGARDNVQGCTRPVRTGDSVNIGQSIAQVYEVPCHTKGHVLYKVGNALFTGDTLFLAGAGRFFEGDARDMYPNFYKTIMSMSDDTLIFCGHEYSLSNLEFCAWLEPDNPAVKRKLEEVRILRKSKYATVPSTLAEERQYNSFLRVREPSIQNRLLELRGAPGGEGDEFEIALLQQIRDLKNSNAHKM